MMTTPRLMIASLLVLSCALGCDDNVTSGERAETAGDLAGVNAGVASGDLAGDTAGESSGGVSAGERAGMAAGMAAGMTAGVSAGERVPPPEPCLDDQSYLSEVAWSEIFSTSCIGCHQAGGPAANTRMVLKSPEEDGWAQHNLAQVTAVIEADEGGLPLLLLKPTGLHSQGHGGGVVIARQSTEFQTLLSLAERILEITDDCGELREGQSPISLDPPEGQCDELKPGRRLLRRLSHQEYQNTIKDLIGVEIDAGAALVADAVEEGFDNHPERLDVSPLLIDQYRELAEQLGETAPLDALLPCEIAEGDVRCAHRFITSFGARAYRRPLTHSEVEQYLQLYRLVVSQECFEQGVRWVIIAMLQSPHFLYRSELGWRPEGSDGDFQLTPYELASELSYLIWQTMPDEELFDAAASGVLLTPVGRRAQLERLLNDPRSARAAQRFFFKWLQLDRLMQVVRDSEIYAALYFEIREAMLRESELFLEELWQSDETLSALFLSTHSWVNEDLAEYYGVSTGEPHPTVHGFYRAQVTPSRPAGLLTHGSFLTTHAAPTSSSPIHRGVIVRERILCDHLDPPPDGLDIMPPSFDPNQSTRERFAAHTEDELCASCHRLIDPIGFGFESYDGIGRYRETEGGLPVDSSGALTRAEGGAQPFNGVGELASLLAQDEQVSACYARQWLRFGVGESEGLEARCYADWLSERFMTDGYKLRSVISALTQTPHFTRRLGGAEELNVPAAAYVPRAQGASPLEAVEAPSDDLEEPACGVPPSASSSAGAGDDRLAIDERRDGWETGYCLYVTVTNASEEVIDGWSVQLNIQGTLTNAWNANYSGESGLVTFSNVEWNSQITPQASVEFGMCASL